MPAQGSVHDVQRAPHQTLGTRRRCRGRADAARSEPASHACAPRNRRASVWHAEDADGGDALSDEDAAEGGDRDGAARARLQPHAREEHRRYQTTSRGDPGLRSVYRCARRVTVQVAQRGPEVAPGLTPDSVQQKYTQTVVSTRIVPGCVQFLGRKNVFTRPGPIAGRASVANYPAPGAAANGAPPTETGPAGSGSRDDFLRDVATDRARAFGRGMEDVVSGSAAFW